MLKLTVKEILKIVTPEVQKSIPVHFCSNNLTGFKESISEFNPRRPGGPKNFICL